MNVQQILTGTTPITLYLKHTPGRPAIVWCHTLTHADFVCEMFHQAGVLAEVITESISPTEREEAVQRFREGSTRVLVNVLALISSEDAHAACEVSMMLGRTQDETRFQLMMMAANGVDPTVIDLADNTARFVKPPNFSGRIYRLSDATKREIEDLDHLRPKPGTIDASQLLRDLEEQLRIGATVRLYPVNLDVNHLHVTVLIENGLFTQQSAGSTLEGALHSALASWRKL